MITVELERLPRNEMSLIKGGQQSSGDWIYIDGEWFYIEDFDLEKEDH